MAEEVRVAVCVSVVVTVAVSVAVETVDDVALEECVELTVVERLALEVEGAAVVVCATVGELLVTVAEESTEADVPVEEELPVD